VLLVYLDENALFHERRDLKGIKDNEDKMQITPIASIVSWGDRDHGDIGRAGCRAISAAH
jgi:hypothetical protein